MQLSKVIGSTVSFIAILGFYGFILTKFYRRKRRQESLNNDQRNISYLRQQKVSFSSVENGKISQILIDSKKNEHQAVSRRLSEISFHLSYIKSSNYILLTLSAYFLCHSPMFLHQLIGLLRYDSIY